MDWALISQDRLVPDDHLTKSKSPEKYGFDNRRPQRISLPSWMQSDFDQKVSAEVTLGVEHSRSDIDVLDTFLRAREIPKHRVCCLHSGPLVQPRLGWLDGNNVDPSFRQRGVNNLDEYPGVIGNRFRRLGRSSREVVVTLINHDRTRVIGNDDSLRILVEVRILRAAKASIDDIQWLHFINERLPASDTRGACENDAPQFRRIDLVLLFKLADRRFPILSLGKCR